MKLQGRQEPRKRRKTGKESRKMAFDGTPLSLLDSYEVQMADVEADSVGETEAGTT